MRKILLIVLFLITDFLIFGNQVFAQANQACTLCLQGCIYTCTVSSYATCKDCVDKCLPSCQNVDPNQLPSNIPANIKQLLPSSKSSTTTPPTGPCAGLQGQPDFGTCTGCVSGGGAYTALGCIDTDPSKFIAWLLKNIIGIAGGIAFLLILYGGFQVLTSGGDPEKLNNGKDIIVSAIAGVLMIVFSVLLLQIIGLDILRIPGFK